MTLCCDCECYCVCDRPFFESALILDEAAYMCMYVHCVTVCVQASGNAHHSGAFTPWWHVQFCWLPIVNSRTLPYLRPVLDSSQWDGSSGVVYQCNWKKLRAISVTYFPNQSILCYILLCPPTPVMLCSWYTTDMDCPHQALSVSDKNNKFDQLLALGMPFLKRT